MTQHARIALIDQDETTAAALAATLDAHGCTVFALKPERREDPLPTLRPDVIVVNAARAPEPAIALARRLGADERRLPTPILVLGQAPDDVPEAATLEAGVESVLDPPFAEAALVSRVRGLARISVMQTELRRRRAIEHRFGIEERFETDDSSAELPANILAVGDFGATTAKTLAQAASAPLRVEFIAEPQAALEALYGGGYDLAVVAVGPEPAETLAWCDAVRDNPRLFNLPILMLGETDAFAGAGEPYRRGFVDVLPTPVDAPNLAAHLRMLLSQQRYRRLLQESYRCPLRRETADGLTGLYSYGFLHEYLASLIAETEANAGAFTVALFDLDRFADINARFGYAAGDSVLRQVGGLFSRLVRGEDLTARYGGDAFCVVMAATPLETARDALARIRHIIGLTEFGLPSGEGAVTVSARMGCAGFRPGDTPESLLARATPRAKDGKNPD